MSFIASNYTILVVDDIQSNILLMKALLRQESYNFISATNGEEALELIDEYIPDLILLDIMMPGLNGFEVAEILRNNPGTSDIPIIFLTALGDSMSLSEGYSKGANDYISKPFQKEELFSRVKYQLMLRDAHRKIREQAEELEAISLNHSALKKLSLEISSEGHTLKSELSGVNLPEGVEHSLSDLISKAEQLNELI